jgi:hypothetical protein
MLLVRHVPLRDHIVDAEPEDDLDGLVVHVKPADVFVHV